MEPFVLSVLILLCLLESIHAGHYLWEDPGKNNTTIAPHTVKRWLAILPEDDFQLWPNREVLYYFADPKAEEALQRLVLQAMEMWYAAGLPRYFKLTKVNKSQYPRQYMWEISWHEPGRVFNCMPGRRTDAEGSDATLSSTTADEGPYKGADLVVTNIAHEIGHIWGLLHEQQNPYFWSDRYAGGKGEDAFIFHCQNLVDFEEKTKGLSYDEIWGEQTGLCMNDHVAVAAGFSALNWVPRLEPIMSPLFRTGNIHDEVDWDSIMLYDSLKGSDDDDTRVLLKADGSSIPKALVPSAGDVLGLQVLYARYQMLDPNNPFEYLPLNDVRNPRHVAFMESVCG